MDEEHQVTRRSTDYAFTTTDLDDERIADLKLRARLMGLEERKLELTAAHEGMHVLYNRRYRVVIRGRLGKDNPNAHLYRAGGKYHRFSSQDIRREHATRFDVYLREVRVWPRDADHF